MSNEHRRQRRGKNYGSKRRNWGDTLSTQRGKTIKRNVEKAERQVSDREIREYLQGNQTGIER